MYILLIPIKFFIIWIGSDVWGKNKGNFIFLPSWLQMCHDYFGVFVFPVGKKKKDSSHVFFLREKIE